jgi:hypothetical protein
MFGEMLLYFTPPQPRIFDEINIRPPIFGKRVSSLGSAVLPRIGSATASFLAADMRLDLYR